MPTPRIQTTGPQSCPQLFVRKPNSGQQQEKTQEQIIDYVRCMTITQNVNPEIYKYLSRDNLKQINDYIDAPMTATWFSEDKNKPGNNKQITSEIIYYWMIAFNIPVEFQKWHLNKLLTLIRVCNVKSNPPKRRSKREIMKRNAALNAARRSRLNTRG